MAVTDVDICNIAQIKLGAEEIGTLTSPVTPAERRYARLYPHYRDVELRARRWHFALAEQVSLTLVAGTTGSANLPYAYLLPTDVLRVIRDKRSQWKQVGQRLYSDDSGALKVDYIRGGISAADFDPNFVEVLACRLAFEAAEKVTQSNTKKQDMWSAYKAALLVAGQTNAFVIGPEDYHTEDSSWLTARL